MTTARLSSVLMFFGLNIPWSAWLGIAVTVAMVWYFFTHHDESATTPMRICHHCGSGHPTHAKFCRHCGKKL